MQTKDLTIQITVDKTPGEVYEAINNVRGWWSEKIEGATTQLNDEFIYRYKDIHYSKQKLVEMIPGKKVVWLVEDSSLNFIQQKDEWNGTSIVFEISQKNGQTQLQFTHIGLTPTCECFEACNDGWGYYINESLLPLINTGKGQPNPEFKAEEKEWQAG